jgi:hypothetical protein
MTGARIFLTVTALAAITGVSCSIPTENSQIGDLPSEKSFTDGKVSLFMEHRCGSLDCHGQFGRPLRIYSEWGLRLKANDDGSRNTAATTADEQKANYQAVIGLQPEELSACFTSKGANFSTLQLLKKPLNISGNGIRHKGGQILRATLSDHGWQCLYGWASGTSYPDECAQASAVQ